MKTFLLGFAYFLIWTTPVQVGFVLWVLWDIVATDYSLLSLSMGEFLQDNLLFLHTWVYSWFWNAWLDFWWQFPAIIMTTLKLLINTWLGFWLLPVAREMD